MNKQTKIFIKTTFIAVCVTCTRSFLLKFNPVMVVSATDSDLQKAEFTFFFCGRFLRLQTTESGGAATDIFISTNFRNFSGTAFSRVSIKCGISTRWFHIFYCSDYPHLLCLDPVITAIWLVSFGLIILSIFHQIMAYAPSIHNNLYSLCQKC
jgi:hypothetical protein